MMSTQQSSNSGAGRESQNHSENRDSNLPSSVEEAIIGMQIAAEKLDYAKFTRLLKSSAFIAQTGPMKPAKDFSEKLLPLLSPIVNELNAALISEWMWSLPRLGFTSSKPTHNELILRIINRFCEMTNLSSRQVTTALGGLARFRNLRFSSMDEHLKSAIIRKIEDVGDQLNDREVGNLLHSMSKIGVPWSSLPPGK